MSREPTNLHRAVSQVFEWTYGNTGIKYDVTTSSVIRTESNQFAFHVVSNLANLTKIKHPLGLVVENVKISLTGNSEMTHDVLGDRIDTKIIDVELQELHSFLLRQDQGGFGIINVQVVMGSRDGGEKSLSTHFVFRNNMLNSIR